MDAVFVPPASEAELWIMLGISFVLLAVKIFALVNALLYSSESYDAAGKLNKTTWCALLGVGLLLQLVPVPIGLVNLIMTIAALVYLADVRPALAGLRRR
ncbi:MULTISPECIES: DUF2516 family protein [unclassified Nocardioides]|jgi:hypothetical protein|uniref:DUF2516 family protein n=1 Tax=unclassified Nocardioides TaxID=2615069 RepID=UPI000703646B|nr:MULTISPECIES: DUF2516 family protein [unclassified Nocardioides]KRC53852.1 hypothetical protein ASE19_07125 [Nocardioides sp. Root79]KRC71188.1 hypothetical protein ASE20_09540 [Nocardioides sp. Root240]